MHGTTRVSKAMVGVRAIYTLSRVLQILWHQSKQTTTVDIIQSFDFKFESSFLEGTGYKHGIGGQQFYFSAWLDDLHGALIVHMSRRRFDLKVSAAPGIFSNDSFWNFFDLFN